MSEEEKTGLSSLEEPTYTPKPKTDRLEGVAAPILEDTAYQAPAAKPHALTDVQAPTLADDTYVDTRKPDRLANVQAPTLADPETTYTKQTHATPLEHVEAPKLEEPAAAPAAAEPRPLSEEQLAVLAERRAASGQPPYTPEQIAAIQEAYLERQRKQVSAPAPQPMVQQEAPQPAPAPAPAVQAPVLEEPEPPTQRFSRFSEEEIAAAKAGAQRRAIEGSLQTEVPVNKEETRRMIAELRRQQESDMAKRGFRIVIVLMILGIVSAVTMFLFTTRPYKDADVSGLMGKIDSAMTYLSFFLGIASILMLARLEPIRKLVSFLFGCASLLMLIGGFILLPQKASGGMALTVIFYAVTLILNFVVCFQLSSNESVGMFFKRREND